MEWGDGWEEGRGGEQQEVLMWQFVLLLLKKDKGPSVLTVPFQYVHGLWIRSGWGELSKILSQVLV